MPPHPVDAKKHLLATTSLHTAALKFDKFSLSDMREMLKTKPVNGKDGLGNTALHYLVCSKENPKNDIVRKAKLLLNNKADINAKNNIGQTPLNKSSGTNNPEVIKLLLDNQASPNVGDLRKTLNSENQSSENIQCVKLFLAQPNMNIFAEDFSGDSPLNLIKKSKSSKNFIEFILRSDLYSASSKKTIYDNCVKDSPNYTEQEKESLECKDLILIKPAIRSVPSHDDLDFSSVSVTIIEDEGAQVIGDLMKE